MRKRVLCCLALVAVALTPGCRSQGSREFTITAFGMTFSVTDKTLPNSEGEDRYEMGLTPGGLAILQTMIAERQKRESEATP